AVNGLKGYVGVDMILTEEEPIVIEVNPRITTSYIGLKRAAKFNTAQAIVDAVIRRKLPTNVHYRGYAFFSKVEVPSCRQVVAETYNLKDVVSPPFPIEENTVYALIASSSSSPRGAQSAFYRTKKRLLSLYGDD
ncbi:ATP-grasp domain-containing protein, partial [Candidatus Bathyarchaeota archaeon]|nr:ATP-grasp domain-containing protein [Candidatus Bathyarchaeota archaeon]